MADPDRRIPELRPLSPGSAQGALEKARHYRLLNEPEEAESICLDVLALEPGHQGALVELLLARADQLEQGPPAALERARELVSQLEGAYERAYYDGLICERQAKYLLTRRGRRCGFVAYEWFQYALEHYQTAMELRSDGNDDPILRWNTCVRIMERNRHCAPAPDDQMDPGIE